MGQEPETRVAIPAKEIDRSELVETFTVREGDKRLQVAANAIANRAMMQINVAKLRMLCERVLDSFVSDPKRIPVGRELKTIVDAVSMVETMSDSAYGDGKTGKLANALERVAYAATRAAIDGGAKLASQGDTAENRLLRMKRIGRKRESVVDVTPEKS